MTIARRWTGDPDKDVTTSEKERDAVWYRLYGNGPGDYLWRAERKRVLDKAVSLEIGDYLKQQKRYARHTGTTLTIKVSPGMVAMIRFRFSLFR